MITQNLFEEVEVEEDYSEDYYDTYGVDYERPEDNIILFKGCKTNDSY